MNELLADINPIDPVTQYGMAGVVAVLMAMAIWWLIYVYKPNQDRLTEQKIKESDRRIVRDDANAESQQKLMDTFRESLPILVQTITETHETNVKLHQQTHEKLNEFSQPGEKQ